MGSLTPLIIGGVGKKTMDDWRGTALTLIVTQVVLYGMIVQYCGFPPSIQLTRTHIYTKPTPTPTPTPTLTPTPTHTPPTPTPTPTDTDTDKDTASMHAS